MAAGRSPIQARLSSSGWAEDLLPQLASFKALGQEVRELQKQYADSGDSASAENVTQIGLNLANHLGTGEDGRFVINKLVGWSIESMVLGQLDSNEQYDFLGGKTPKERLAEIKDQRESLRALRQNFRDELPGMSESDLLSYTERQRVYGETEAMRWLQQRTSATSNSRTNR